MNKANLCIKMNDHEMQAVNQTGYFFRKIKKSCHTQAKPILKPTNMRLVKKKSKFSGQGMTEYLIIVALIAVGSIAIVRTVGGSLRVGFAKVAMGIQGEGKPSSIKAPKVNSSQYQRNDMSDFTNGANR